MHNWLRTFILIFISMMAFSIFANEKSIDKNDKEAIYQREMLRYTVKEEFDQRYPLNVKKFTFYKGNEEITLKDLIKLTQDPMLLKVQERIKNIKTIGFTTAAVFAGCTVSFAIPSIVFIAKQTNYNKVDSSYTFSGVGMVILTLVSFAGLMIDLIITAIALYRNKFSEYPVRKAIENYNQELRKKLGIEPELSLRRESIELSFLKRF